jgi:hypothetical protein
LTLRDIVQKSLNPLIYANLVGMVLAGLSLIAFGFFPAVWPGFVALLVSPIVFPLLLLPAGFFSGVMVIVQKSHPRVEKAMMVLSVLYLITVLTAYVMLSYHLVGHYVLNRIFLADGVVWQMLIPAMVYGAAAGVAPWLILAAKDRDNVFFTGLVFMAEVTALVVMAAGVWQEWSFWHATRIFWLILALLMVIEAAYEKHTAPKNQDAPKN